MDKNYKTVLLVATVLYAIGYFASLDLLLWIGFGLSVLSIVSGKFANFFSEYWMKLGKIIGWLPNKIILGLVYYVVLTPLALLKKITQKSTVHNQDTNFILRQKVFEKKDLEKLY